MWGGRAIRRSRPKHKKLPSSPNQKHMHLFNFCTALFITLVTSIRLASNLGPSPPPHRAWLIVMQRFLESPTSAVTRMTSKPQTDSMLCLLILLTTRSGKNELVMAPIALFCARACANAHLEPWTSDVVPVLSFAALVHGKQTLRQDCPPSRC